MKKNLLLLFISILAFSPFLSYAEDSKIKIDIGPSEKAKKILGLAMEEEKQGFENRVKGFLMLSLDDKMYGRSVIEIDMEGRKKYFTNSGWKKYLDYVRKHKDILEVQKVETYRTQVMARFVYGTQQYQEEQEEQDKHHLQAKVIFCYSLGCVQYCGWDKEYEINVYAEGDITDPEQMLITDWQVDLGEK
ncbi:MAG: hypothetical protein OEY94_08045 [Alphaproteobacteria bacterium]|nr:hypothetical protein [Alphaproteobacteria bacterium]